MRPTNRSPCMRCSVTGGAALLLILAVAGCRPTYEEQLRWCSERRDECEADCPDDVDSGMFTSMGNCLDSCTTTWESCEVDAYNLSCTPPPCGT
jgi:hypothetical protein